MNPGAALSSLAIASIACALIFTATLLGAFLRTKLPEHHLTGDSKDVIKLGIALIATMSALVLALLFSATRASFERTTGFVSRMTVDARELDGLLAEYGPEAKPLRIGLQKEVGKMIDSIWVENARARGVAPATGPLGGSVLYMLRSLTPTTAMEKSIQDRAILVSTDLYQTLLTLTSQPSDAISNPFMVVLVLWLMFIFAIFSMSSTPNPTMISILCLCVLSASGAIYLILELDQPFDGLMQISDSALRAAVSTHID
jgi:hypothetical protein